MRLSGSKNTVSRLQIVAFANQTCWGLVIFSINHLDLRELQQREFLNLRVAWGIGCSTGSINTTRVNEESGSTPEQQAMQEVSNCSSRTSLILGIK
jgi:hypothetical protein